MSPTTWSSTSSATPRVPSPTLPRHRTWTYTTLRSASCSPNNTENMPITAIRKACLSVSRHCLSCSIEQGNVWEKAAQTHRLGACLMNKNRQTIIAEYCEKIGHHELQAARAEEERRILQEELWRQQKDFREVHQQSLTEMQELRKFQRSTFDTLTRQKLVEDQNTIMELQARLQELQNEVNCMNDFKDFEDAESVRSGNSHVTSQRGVLHKHPILDGMWRPSFVSTRRKEGAQSIWDTHGLSGNFFENPHASSSAPYPQELNPWVTTIEEPLYISTAEKSERPEQNQDLRCQCESFSQIFSHLQWRRLCKELWS